MDPGPCRFCGSSNRPGARFCTQCGSRYSFPPSPAPLGPRYWSLRFQVDPLSPPPQRDIRWILIVLGIAFVIVGILFLGISAIVSGALAAGSPGCPSPPCQGVDPGVWFDWIGVPFLALGIGMLVLGLWWALR